MSSKEVILPQRKLITSVALKTKLAPKSGPHILETQ